jgi:hypothetical protein
MVSVSDKAEKIVDAVLSSNDKILLVSIRAWNGTIIAVKYRDTFRERFNRVSSLIGTTYSGSLTIATLGLVNEVKDIFGEARVLVTFYDDCKVILIPMPSHEIIVGLTVERSPEIEEKEEGYNIAKKIERLVAKTS